MIYIQAKRWNGNVGAPALRDFVGSLVGNKTKGVFITTSDFTGDALKYTETVGHRTIILINGEKLTELMIEYNVGVSKERSYDIKRIDYDYFLGEETV